MKKNWNLLKIIDNDFREKNSAYSELILQLLWNRELTNEEEINFFLNANYKNLFDYNLFSQIDVAVELIINNIKKQNLIFVYGDYDADGVTASSLLFNILELFKARVEVYIPHRVIEGYGLNKGAIDYINEKKAKLIVTVDGGIRNKEEVDYAKENGIDVIITDHHIPPEKKIDYPDCIIINPLIEGETYPEKGLAGVGVAFKLAEALIKKSKLKESDKELLVKSCLDLVAIGTVADCVPLRGENRILVKEGLKFLSKTKKLGLKELIEVSGIKNKDKIDSWNIGFQIGPRLNAAGRMEHANTAFELLINKNLRESKKLAKDLNERNKERQKITEEIFSLVEKQIDNEKAAILIGVCDSTVKNEKDDLAWNEGVIGLVAGKINSKYYRPALVITKTEDGYKGSGRSIKEFNLIEAVEECSTYLTKYGGHPQACGFSLKEENLEVFLKKIRKVSEDKIGKMDLRPQISVEKEIELGEINDDFYKIQEMFAPFGQTNEKPCFLSQSVKILDIQYLGVDATHLKFRLKQNDSKTFSALAFSKAEEWSFVKIGDIIDIVYYVELNEFNGRHELQLRLLDIN